MSNLKTYRVDITSDSGRSGDLQTVRARTEENAVKRVRKNLGEGWQNGHFTIEEVTE